MDYLDGFNKDGLHSCLMALNNMQ